MQFYATVACILMSIMTFLYVTSPGKFRLAPLIVLLAMMWLWPVLLCFILIVLAVIIIPDWRNIFQGR